MTPKKHGESAGESSAKVTPSRRRLVSQVLENIGESSGESSGESGEGCMAKSLKSLRRRLAKVGEGSTTPKGVIPALGRDCPIGVGGLFNAQR